MNPPDVIPMYEKWIVVVLVIYTISLHELAHAWAATWLGDPTPGIHGRLTWNPLVQLDWFFSILMPLLTFYSMGWPMGFAYCPIDPSKFRRPLRDRALVAMAGPAANFAVVLVLFGLLYIPFIARDGYYNQHIFYGLAI